MTAAITCAVGSAILLVWGGVDKNDPYVVSRSVANPAICQTLASDFIHRWNGQAACLIEIPAIKGDKQ